MVRKIAGTAIFGYFTLFIVLILLLGFRWHRHRKAPDQPIMQVLEIGDHPFFMATQSHPELTSRPLAPEPMFTGLVAEAMRKANPKENLPNAITAAKKVR